MVTSETSICERLMLVAAVIMLSLSLCESRALTPQDSPASDLPASDSPPALAPAAEHPAADNTVTLDKVALVTLVRDIMKRILMEAELRALQAHHAEIADATDAADAEADVTFDDLGKRSRRIGSIDTMMSNPVFMSRLRTFIRESLGARPPVASSLASNDLIMHEILQQLD